MLPISASRLARPIGPRGRTRALRPTGEAVFGTVGTSYVEERPVMQARGSRPRACLARRGAEVHG